MLQIAICDDLSEDRQALRALLESMLSARTPDYALTEYRAGEALLDDYIDGDAAYDILFLDVFMGGITGLQTAARIRALGVAVPIVFLTTTPDFAVESYEVQAFDYLLKPVSLRRLEGTMGRFFALHSVRATESLLVTYRGQGRRIPYGDILCVESEHNGVLIHCLGGEEHRLRSTMAEVERELSKRPNFLRTHQSFLLNMDYVVEAGEDFLLQEGLRVPMKVRQRKHIRDCYFEYMLSRQREECLR